MPSTAHARKQAPFRNADRTRYEPFSKPTAVLLPVPRTAEARWTGPTWCLTQRSRALQIPSLCALLHLHCPAQQRHVRLGRRSLLYLRSLLKQRHMGSCCSCCPWLDTTPIRCRLSHRQVLLQSIFTTNSPRHVTLRPLSCSAFVSTRPTTPST